MALAGTDLAPSSPPVLSGNHFDLVVEQMVVNFTGCAAVATAVNGSVPAPLLRWREGDTVTIAVTNV
jgi:FtsP/CotA-like multicopper oxidase with cupredoxin domain